VAGVAVLDREAVEAEATTADAEIRRPVRVGADRRPDRRGLADPASAQRIGPLVDVVVPVDDEVDFVLVEQRRPAGLDTALGGVVVGRGVRAVVKEDDHEVDVGLLAQEREPLREPRGLAAPAVAEVGGIS